MSLMLRILLWWLILMPPHPVANLYAGEITAKAIVAENDRYHVALVGEGEPWYDPRTGGRVKFTFSVTDKIQEKQYPIYLNNITSTVNNIAIVQAMLIVFTEEATLHLSVVTLMDLEDRNEIDSLAGFGHTLSDTGRFLSYRKFYPPQTAEPPMMSDLVLIYDLSDSPNGNRLLGEAAYNNDPLGRLIEVGHPVYPERNVRKKNYRVWVRDENGRHSIIPDGFFWLDHDRKIAFGDRVGGETYWVIIDISKGLDKPTIYKKWIDVLALLRPEDRQNESLIHEAKQLSLEGIQEMNNGMMRVRIRSEVPLTNNVLEIPLEEVPAE